MLIQKLEKLPTTTSNSYNGFEADELVEYGDYQQPWKLDSGASGHYCGLTTGVRNRRKKRNGIKVQVADGKNIDQIQEGIAPFNRLPEQAADVQIFLHMANLLMSCGKIVRTGHKIILDDPIATVIKR